MPGLPKELMRQVGKGKITMKEAWARTRGELKFIKKHQKKLMKKQKRGGYTAKKKRHGRKRKTIMSIVDKAVKASCLMFPEIRTVSEAYASGDMGQFPRYWLLNRTGYDLNAWGACDYGRLIQNYAIPTTALLLYSLTKRIGSTLR